MLNTVTKNEGQWDQFVQKNGGNFLQSWAWGEFQEKLGRRVFRFRVDGAREGGDARTVAQFVVIDLPLRFGKRYLYVPRGPVVDVGEADAADANLDSTLEAFREYVRQAGATFGRVEWPWPTSASPVDPARAEKWGFVKSGHVQPEHTVICNLNKSEDLLLVEMHQKTRYNIRVAQKHGVVVREVLAGTATNADERQKAVETFWGMLNVTASRDNFHTHERNYYAKMIEVLGGPHAEDGGMRVRLHVAEYEGRPVAAALTAEYGDTVTYLHGASLDADRRVMAPHVLHWEIMRAAKAAGFAKYDFWGVAPEGAENHPWAGITRFKTGFGGDRVSYLGAWELPNGRFWYRVYRLAKSLRRHP